MTRPTLREALADAQRDIDSANAALAVARKRRLDLMRTAHDRGASVRAIAEVLGLTGAAVQHQLGRRGGTETLDAPLERA